MRLQSPDRRLAVHVNKEEWWLEVGDQKLSPEEPRVTADAEFGWSPDGKAFYITQSENVAEVEGFHTEVYSIDQGHFKRLADVNEIVQQEFNRHHACGSSGLDGQRYSEDADIVAVKWVEGSDQLLMVAEAPLDSNCGREYFAGYLVSLNSGSVIRRYSARQLMQKWNRAIGDRLKDDFRGLKTKQRKAASSNQHNHYH